MKSKCGKNACIRIKNDDASNWLGEIEKILTNNKDNKGLTNNTYNEDVCYYACLKGKTPKVESVREVGMADATKEEICNFLKYLCKHPCYWVAEDIKNKCCKMTGLACNETSRIEIKEALEGVQEATAQ